MRFDEVSADIKIFISLKSQSRHSPGLGLGVVELCERVERLGSLNKAAADMGMAYSKAWRIIKRTEEELDLALFHRQGAHGSSLTDEAKALIELFRKVERETTACANQVLHESLDELLDKGVLSHVQAPKLETKATPELIALVRELEL
jgi:molybdate transport system regulatory protein